MSTIRRAAAYILLVSVYGFTWLMAVVGGLIPHRAWKPTGRIMVAGTFHNPNWYLSHVTPLVHSGATEVILVVDKPQLPLAGVTFVCWPRWVSTLLSRAGARGVWVILTGLRYRPDLYMGYHLGPGACTMLMAGKLMGRPTCYQMTGGPVEIIGGGDATEGIGAPLRRPSRIIEMLALAVVRLFDLVVVRGSKARDFLTAHGIEKSVAVITGSVQNCLAPAGNGRDIHLVFIGRLSPIKQVDQFIKIVDVVRRDIPDIHASIIGEGPLGPSLQAHVEEAGLARNIEFLGKRKDIESFLTRSKVFILTSKSEGLSIAMAEAMRAGVVPVVADVGDLGDLVIDGVNGYLVEPGNIGEYATKVLSLLRNDPIWAQFSHSAIGAAKEHCDLDVVSQKWQHHLQGVISHATGCCPHEVLN
jgi:hypothetical protein